LKPTDRENLPYVNALIDIEIGIHVTLMCPPDCAGHTWPRLFEGKDSLDIISMDFLSRYWIDDGRLNAEERK
jgi:hypothetical protein